MIWTKDYLCGFLPLQYQVSPAENMLFLINEISEFAYFPRQTNSWLEDQYDYAL